MLGFSCFCKHRFGLKGESVWMKYVISYDLSDDHRRSRLVNVLLDCIGPGKVDR